MSKVSYESSSLERIHAKSNTKKNECFFVGFLDGILANQRIDPTELEPLLAECGAMCRLVQDEDAAEIIAEASVGHAKGVEELLGVLTQIAEIRSSNIDSACKRSSANRILGFCAGVNCDSVVTTREAQSLSKILQADHDLSDDPRISALRHSLQDALADGVIDPLESSEISDLITKLVGDSYSDTGIPSSESIPVIQDLDEIDETAIEGRKLVLTGKFIYGERTEVKVRLESFGAIVQDNPTKETDMVIIGSQGSPHWTHKMHGGKLAKALSMRAKKPAPRIYLEMQLRGILI